MLKLFNFSNRPSWIFRCTRNYNAKAQPDPAATIDTDEYEKKTTSRMRKYFEEHELTDVVKQAPASFLKRIPPHKLTYCTALNPKLAKRMAFSICSRLEEGCIVESDPGFGFMSRIFASAVPNLLLYEKSEDFRSKLEDLKMKHENVQINDINVWTLMLQILVVGEETLPKVTDFYQSIESIRNANDSQNINWVISGLTRRSIKTLCYLYLLDSSFRQLGKMTFFITMPSTLYKVLSQPMSPEVGSQNATAAALFQIVFNFEVLMTGIPRKMFIPWPALKDRDEELYLIRVSPKDDLKTILDSDSLVRTLIKFLQIGLRNRQRVIPLLEKYVNNCGPLFILEHDITVYTEFMELSPEKILSLFSSFSKLPEFSHFTFIDEEADEPDEYLEPEANEKKSNDEDEDVAGSEDEEGSQSEDESNESSQKDTEEGS